MDPAQLNAAAIVDLLRYGVLNAHLPTGARDRSTVYRYIEKIYRAGPEEEEVKNWFRCSWCLTILNCVTRHGTAPLHRHLQRCNSRPAGILDFLSRGNQQQPNVVPVDGKILVSVETNSGPANDQQNIEPVQNIQNEDGQMVIPTEERSNDS